MHILLTFDVELSPDFHWRHPDRLRDNVQRSYYGGGAGRWGLEDQLKLLSNYGLKAVFFVEALSACVTGPEQLLDVCALIRRYNQDIQLHTHPEWLELRAGNQEKPSRLMADLSEAQQSDAIAVGLSNLAAAGCKNIIAHRAGGFGANFDTLRSCADAGLTFDSSYNAAMLDHGCGLDQEYEQTRLRKLEGVWEVPVTCFRQSVGGARPLQLCAVSSREMQQALARLKTHGACVATIVSHSFELLTRDRSKIQPVHVSRFESLCRFLAENLARFETIHFDDLANKSLRDEHWSEPPVKVDFHLTAARYFGQAIGRAYEW
jgi:hypothetical protein